jgi:hypothetical protein
MDQSPGSLPKHRPSPRIVAPANHDSIEGHTVTVWGAAEPGVAVELWDWLSLVAHTVADNEGHWSITLEDVESGEHVYFAQTLETSDRPADRSDTTTVRVGSPNKHWQVERTPTIALPWQPPRVGIIRKLRGRRRQANDEDRKGDAFVEEEWERILAGRETPLSTEDLPGTFRDEPSVAVNAAEEPSELPSTIDLEPSAESETVVEEVPIEVSATMIVAMRRSIEVLVEEDHGRAAPIDLGPVEAVSGPLPTHQLRCAPVIVSAVPTPVRVDQVLVNLPPIYRPITRLTPPIPAHQLGTAALVTESPHKSSHRLKKILDRFYSV